MITENFFETYKIKPNSTLNITNTNGAINICKWDKDYMELAAQKKADMKKPI